MRQSRDSRSGRHFREEDPKDEHSSETRGSKEPEPKKQEQTEEAKYEAFKQWEERMAKAQEKIEQENRNCGFYMKTGCCRYGEACSKFHPYPSISCTILFRNMYTGIGMVAPIDEDGDVELQYDENEIMSHFHEFWKDIVPEFEKHGEIRVLRVCRNFSQHLRGNVYVTYTSEESAKKAASLNGRFYAGKQLMAEFSPIEDWKKALCGSSARSQCERGPNCNFLHVFRNPGGQYEGEDSRKPRFEEDRDRRTYDRFRDDKRGDRADDRRHRPNPPGRRDDDRRRYSEDRRRDDRDRDRDRDRDDHRRHDDARKRDDEDRRKRRFDEADDSDAKKRRVDS